MANYMELLGAHFPGVEAYVEGDPSVYANIVWKSTSVTQAELDAVASETIVYPDKVKQFTYGDSEGNPLKTAAATFTRVRALQYDGSVTGPRAIRFTAWCDASSTGEVRLFDVTNGNVLCTAEIAATEESILTHTSITNWPTSLSLIEVQLRRKTGNSKKHTHLSGMVLVY